MSSSRPTVLILSTTPAFARDLSARWPSGSVQPEFTVLEHKLFRGLSGNHYDLAIVDAAPLESVRELKRALAGAGKPVFLIYSAQKKDNADPALPMSLTDGSLIELYLAGLTDASEPQAWAEIVGLLARESLRRSATEARLRSIEASSAHVNADATLGRYMVEMRHNVNNALTSILGNAELLMLEPGLPANVVAEADTIRNMTLRLDEIYRRFSSLERELSVAARESGKSQVKAAAAGTH